MHTTHQNHTSLPLTPDVLKHFDKMVELRLSDLNRLIRHAKVRTVPSGSVILERGCPNATTLYLLEGEVRMIADDGVVRTLNARQRSARSPISRLRPSCYRVSALTEVSYVEIDNDILDDFLPFDEASSVPLADSYLVAESTLYPGSGGPLMPYVYEGLRHGSLTIPLLAPVAERVGDALLAVGDDRQRMKQILMTDPAIAALTIRAANAKLAPHQPSAVTVSDALVQLGPEQTLSLVTGFMMRETLHSPTPMVAKWLHAWWERSLRVSIICSILARVSNRFDPELAALAGLLHRVGEAVLLGAAHAMEEPVSQCELGEAIAENFNDIGRVVLSMWNFSPELVVVASEAGNFTRDHPHPADYADIVLVAERHADIGFYGMHNHEPAPDQMPAFDRLGLHRASPELSMRIMDAARKGLEEAEAALAVR